MPNIAADIIPTFVATLVGLLIFRDVKATIVRPSAGHQLIHERCVESEGAV